MRTTLTLDDDVYEAARALASAAGEPMGKVLSDLARRALRPQPPQEVNGLPVFAVPANAALIPTGRAADLLAKEGEP